MTHSTTREVVNVFWPMIIPAHARFYITSPFPLKASYPHNIDFTLTLEAPIHLSSPSPVHVIPFGILSPGFARGWSTLPTELKLAVLRHDLIYSSVIWPANANRAMRKSLFPYLRMTPEIASLSRDLFFAENTFVIYPIQEELSIFCGLPPISVRPLIRKVQLLTWLEPGDWETVNAIAQKRLGFEDLTHVEIRCSAVKFVRQFFAEHGTAEGDSDEVWAAYLNHRLPPDVRPGPNVVVLFDRLEFGGGGVDNRLLERVEQMEGLAKERFELRVRPRG